MTMKTTRLTAKLRELARASRGESDLEGVFRRFEELVSTCGLIEASRPGRHPRLEAMLVAVSGKLRGRSASVVLVTPLFGVHEERFWHGAVSIGGSMGTCFYFEEQDIGLLEVEAPGGIAFVRFTALDLAEHIAATQRGPRGVA